MPSFPEQGAFDPEATAAMGVAFDAACEELHCTTQPEVVRELIATLIIAAASRGELDPDRLRMVAVTGFATLAPATQPLRPPTQSRKVNARGGPRDGLGHKLGDRAPALTQIDKLQKV